MLSMVESDFVYNKKDKKMFGKLGFCVLGDIEIGVVYMWCNS